MKNHKVLLLALLVSILSSGCDIRLCYDSPRRIKEAAKYTTQIPVSAGRLKGLLQEDTSAYKIVVLYDYCCSSCRRRFTNVYSTLWKASDTNIIHWYFVQIDCGGVRWNEEYLHDGGIYTDRMYYILDDNPLYANTAQLTNFLFDKALYADSVYLGIPMEYIISKSGQVKLRYLECIDVSSFVLGPMQLDEFKSPIETLDFSTIDTVSATAYNRPACTNAECN